MNIKNLQHNLKLIIKTLNWISGKRKKLALCVHVCIFIWFLWFIKGKCALDVFSYSRKGRPANIYNKVKE